MNFFLKFSIFSIVLNKWLNFSKHPASDDSWGIILPHMLSRYTPVRDITIICVHINEAKITPVFMTIHRRASSLIPVPQIIF